MSRHIAKAKNYNAGIWSLRLLVAAIAAAGVNAWYHNSTDLLSQIVTMGAASLTALTLMFCVEAIGRAWSTFGLLPILILCAGMQTVTFERSADFYVEAPHKAEFAKELQPLQAEVKRTTEHLTKAEADFDAITVQALPERCKIVACPETIKANAKAYADARAAQKLIVDTAKADKATAEAALKTKADAYTPAINSIAVLVVGGAIDLAIALGIWALGGAARRSEIEAKTEADRIARKVEREARKAAEERRAARLARKKETEKKAKAEVRKSARKPQTSIAQAVLSEGEKAFFGPGLRMVVNNT